jgi:hypothetical protein
MAKGTKIMAQGVGPSKLNRDATACYDPFAALCGLHFGGKPVEAMPEADVARLAYQHSDEAIAARNAGKVDSAARVTAGPFEKSVAARRDFRQAQKEPWEAPNPMGEIADAHTPPGMTPKFLSPAKLDREGPRGYEIVKNAAGDLVRLGRMVLGIMPKERSKLRADHYRGLGNARLKRIEQENEEQQRALRDGNPRPFALAGGASLDPGDGLYSDRGEEID